MNSSRRTLYAGSYRPVEEPGIYRLSLDTDTGELVDRGSIAGISSPAYIALHPNKRWIYAASETSMQDGIPGSVWAVDVTQEQMTLINSQASGGDFPCHAAIDGSGQWVVVSNYGTGNVGVLPILPDGSLGEMSDLVQHHGSGPVPERQEGPHAHSSIFTPDNRFVITADLGVDALVVYTFDPVKGSLQLHEQVKTRPGAGPRHMAWHRDEQYLYVANELNGTVAVYAYDGEKGKLIERQVVATLDAPEDTEGNWVSDIHIAHGGDRVYVSNRRMDGRDNLAIFKIGVEGRLERISVSPCGGRWPRMFAIAPGDRFIVVANEHSDRVSVLPIQGEHERLGVCVATFALPRASCIQFVETDS